MYNTCLISEHQGNPLIEALPMLVDDQTILKRLRSYQKTCTTEEREMPDFVRKKFLHRLEQFVEPTYSYLTCYRMVEDLIAQSYIPKNPRTKGAQYWLHHDNPCHHNYGEPARFEPRSVSMAVIGDGGSGKTWMLEAILKGLGPQVIRHKYYKSKPLNITQIVWLKVNCTENANVAALLTLILEELDGILGTKDADVSLSTKARVAQASIAITRKMKSIFLGVLIIDEIQHLKFANAALRELFIQFLINTLGRAGVPIIFAGDPRVSELLSVGLPVSRRAEAGGVIFMQGYFGHEWDLFVEALWDYQWTNQYTPLSPELSDCLLDLSTGLPDFAIKIFKAAQGLVIGNDDERLSPAILRQAYAATCVLSDKELEKRRTTLRDKLGKGKKDVQPATREELCEVSSGVVSEKAPTTATKERAIFDVNRVQHPEFKTKVAELQNNACMPPSHVELDTIRKAAVAPDSLTSLVESKILLRHTTLYVQ